MPRYFLILLYIQRDKGKKIQNMVKIVLISVGYLEMQIFLMNLYWIKITMLLIDHAR
jgi:hypothetical protein